MFSDKYIDHIPKLNSGGEGHYGAHLFSVANLFWVRGTRVDSLWGEKSNKTNCLSFRYKRICSSCPAAQQMGWREEGFSPFSFIMHLFTLAMTGPVDGIHISHVCVLHVWLFPMYICNKKKHHM